MTAAAIEDTTTADMWVTENEPRITSSAKSMPAIGALKEAPIPAAAPAATRLFTRSSPRPSRREIEEPMAPPIWTIGPSRPADPPPPRVKAVAAIFSGIERVDM